MLALLQALLLQQLATRSTALHETARVLIDNSTLPRDGRAAIVLRGQTFRCGGLHEKRRSCCSSAIHVQKEATASLVEYVIQPLEAWGNKVDVVVTDGECNLTAGNLLSELGRGGDRVLRWEQRKKDGALYPQLENIRFALETFKQAAGGYEQIAKNYDLVLLLRQDTKWKKSINEWKDANFSKFNFASRCQKQALIPECNNDLLHIMPGRLFEAFDSEVGTKDCFFVSPGKCKEGHYCVWDSGHGCLPQVRDHMGEANVGFITPWKPRRTVREINPFWVIYAS